MEVRRAESTVVEIIALARTGILFRRRWKRLITQIKRVSPSFMEMLLLCITDVCIKYN